MTDKARMEWAVIEPLPDDWEEMCREDLRAVQEQWVEERSLLIDPAKADMFQDRLANRWAIETGIIERLYTIDRGITVTLLDVGLDALGRYHAEGKISTEARQLIRDQRDALDMVMDLVGGGRELTDSFIKELHHGMTRSQEYADAVDPDERPLKIPLQKGVWKRVPNNPTRPDGIIHEYTPPEFVQDEVEQLLEWYRDYQDRGVCVEVLAAWFHHRFTQIHPFQDGNGRVVRALTAGIFLKSGYLTLVIRDEEHRTLYLDALASADQGDLKPLVDLFSDIQIEDLTNAIDDVRSMRGETMVRLAESVAERAARRREQDDAVARAVTERLVDITFIRLSEVAAELERQFQDRNLPLMASAYRDDADTEHYWTTQIVEAAQRTGYFVDLTRFRRWCRLRLRIPELVGTQTNFIISFNAVGRAADLRAVTAFLSTSAIGDEPLPPGLEAGSIDRWSFDLAARRPFNYRTTGTDLDALESRFRNWLEEAIENAIDLWARSI